MFEYFHELIYLIRRCLFLSYLDPILHAQTQFQKKEKKRDREKQEEDIRVLDRIV